MNSLLLRKDFRRNKWIYLLALPIILYYIAFQYVPMYGALIAFQDYAPMKGIRGSEWVGFKHFLTFADSYYFWRLLKNTLLLSLYSLLFEFTAPIILALCLNEIRSRRYRGFIQSVAFMPYFISLIVVCAMIKDFTKGGGLLHLVYLWLGGEGNHDLLLRPELFRFLYVASEIWQRVGWESIIYVAALLSISTEQYEAARIDGAGRWRQMISITLPGLLPTIAVMFILRIGHMLDIGYEKILLLYSPVTYETADIISTFVYRKGLLDNDWSFSTAIGLFQSVFGLLLLLAANAAMRAYNRNSLW